MPDEAHLDGVSQLAHCCPPNQCSCSDGSLLLLPVHSVFSFGFLSVSSMGLTSWVPVSVPSPSVFLEAELTVPEEFHHCHLSLTTCFFLSPSPFAFSSVLKPRLPLVLKPTSCPSLLCPLAAASCLLPLPTYTHSSLLCLVSLVEASTCHYIPLCDP